jgi:hypothetical protein
MEAHYDLQTPVIVHQLHPQPEQHPLAHHPSEHRSQSDDNTSLARDNVLPGEEVLYEGIVQASGSLRGPFEPAALKVFRNTLSNELRFYTRAGHNSETFWRKSTAPLTLPPFPDIPHQQG